MCWLSNFAWWRFFALNRVTDEMNWWFGSALMGVFSSGALVAGSLWLSGSIVASPSKLFDGEVTLERPHISLGQTALDEVIVPVKIVNRSSRPVRIVGAALGCSCMSNEPLPIAVPEHSQRLVNLTISRGDSAGRFRLGGVFYADCPGTMELPFEISGEWRQSVDGGE